MKFPDCTIHDMPQRSPEWYDIRKGVLTASCFGAWLTDKKEVRATVADMKQVLDLAGKEYKKSATRPELIELCQSAGLYLPADYSQGTKSARLTAASKLLNEIDGNLAPPEFEVDPEGPPPRNIAAWRIWFGIRNEEAAVASFEKATGRKVKSAGFCRSKLGHFGCSPDGLIPDYGEGFEGKCPPEKHYKYLLDDMLPDDYRDQVHGSMAVTGAKVWWFQSWLPGRPALRIPVMRSDYTERMLEGLVDFSDYFDELKDQLAEMWEETSVSVETRETKAARRGNGKEPNPSQNTPNSAPSNCLNTSESCMPEGSDGARSEILNDLLEELSERPRRFPETLRPGETGNLRTTDVVKCPAGFRPLEWKGGWKYSLPNVKGEPPAPGSAVGKHEK